MLKWMLECDRIKVGEMFLTVIYLCGEVCLMRCSSSGTLIVVETQLRIMSLLMNRE